MDLEKLAAIGLQLGFSGAELNKWIEAQQAKLRDERAAEREAAKEADERQREILQLKLKLQEGAQNMPVAANDALTAPSTSSPLNPQKLLPVFDEKRDDLHAYLQRFERVATGQDWPQEKWGLAVSLCLTGDALTVIGRMTAADSLDYQKVKKALLQRFQFTAQGYQDKFRKARAADGETGRQLAARITSYFDHWIDMANVSQTYEGLRDHVISEQFLRCCHPKLVVFLKERECKSLDELANLTDRFLEAQNLTNIGKGPDPAKESSGKPTEASRKPQLKCILCHRFGHLAPDCRNPPKQMLKCKLCGKTGHVTETCRNQHGNNKPSSSCAFSEPDSARAGARKTAKRPGGKIPCSSHHDDKNVQGTIRFLADGMPVVEGLLLGREVRVLRDTGCNTAIVRRELVPDVCLTGKKISVVLLDRSTSHLPEAIVQVNTPYFTGMLKVACMDQPLYDLVLGNLPGVRGPYDPDSDWKQATHTQVDELPAQAHPTKSPVTSRSASSSVAKTKANQQGQENIRPLYVSTTLLPDVTRAQLVEEQRNDPTLKAVFAKVNKEFKSGKGHCYDFIEDKGLLYRRYRLATGRTFKQLVTPKAFRVGILDIAHGSIMAGHQGIKRTTDRVLEEFYWPDLNGDVKRFVKSCDKCQRTTPKGKVGVAPLGNMPLIRTPFERVAVDLIGPFSPRSDRGNRYVLTLIDFATRYPDAVALPAIDAVHIAEALIEIFSRIGLPKEIVTDQGASFTSELMNEVSRLLSVKMLKTTPYHAMANGLVEKFNGTLKTMLKRMCQERPRSWDRYLAPLLFAYREVPQTSLGFSPFQLIYGRHVRGPLTVLRELWTNEGLDAETRTTYTYVFDLRNRLEETCKIAHEQLEKARVKQKTYYDRKSRPRKLCPGNKVLILLPTDSNKLLMQWKGPFQVIERKNDVDYVIDVFGKNKIFHINMLKKYEEREVTEPQQVSVVAELHENLPEEEDEVKQMPILSLYRTQFSTDVKLSPHLTAEQVQNVQALFQEYADIFSDLPGKTALVECSLRLTSNKPVHVPQYPIPLALQERVEKEVQEMLKLGIIERSQSPYHAPIVVMKKPDNTIRLCIDFRELNKILVPDCEPIPRIDVVLALVGQKQFFSKFDFTKGYWQVPMDPNSREKTAFSSMSGLYHFLYMPFGIKTAPAVFARLMRSVLGGVDNVHHYFDDVIIATDTWQEHIDTLRQVFERINQAHLTIKPSKCEIGERSISFLGHRIGETTVEPLLKTLDKILAAKRPTTKKAVQSFLGLTGYYRKFIPNYAELTKPLTDLTRKGQSHTVSWGAHQEEAFTALKKKLGDAPILLAPDLSKEFVLRTDASNTSLGAVLLQMGKGQVLHPVAYASRNLLPRETHYSTIERECLALVWAVQKFHIYLYGKPFVIQSDHQPLQYLNSAKHVNNRVLRWSLLMQEYSFTVHYIKGCDNVGADYLSRA